MKTIVCIPVIILYIWFMKINHIYTITDPRTQEVFYVGQTTDPKTRFKEHKFKRYSANQKKREIIESIKNDGLMPVFDIIHSTADPLLADKKEEETILSFNGKLCNIFTTGKLGSADKRKKKHTPNPKLSQASTCKKEVAMMNEKGEVLKVWESACMASSETGISRGSIACVARGDKRRKTAGGYLWKYI